MKEIISNIKEWQSSMIGLAALIFCGVLAFHEKGEWYPYAGMAYGIWMILRPNRAIPFLGKLFDRWDASSK